MHQMPEVKKSGSKRKMAHKKKQGELIHNLRTYLYMENVDTVKEKSVIFIHGNLPIAKNKPPPTTKQNKNTKQNCIIWKRNALSLLLE